MNRKAKQGTILTIFLVFAIILLIAAVVVFVIFGRHTHNLTHYQEIIATCTADGTIEHYHCDKCNKNFADEDGIKELDSVLSPKLEHDFVWIIDKPATDTETGYKHEECTYCGVKRNENTEISKPSHIHSMIFIEAKVATCIADGIIEHYHCDECNKNYADKDGIKELYTISSPKLEHDFEWIIDKPATDTETGYKHEECTNCGEKRNENTEINLPSHIHNMTFIEANAATCTAGGTIEHYYCDKCNKNYADKDGIKELGSILSPSLGHNAVADTAKAATCTQTGLTEGQHCSRCKVILIAQKIVPELGHKYSSQITREATCSLEGEITYTCTHSPCTDKYTESIPFTEHLYGEAISKDLYVHEFICSSCNDTKTEAHTMTGADNCNKCTYFIPDTAFEGSAITDNMLSQRIPISQDFHNVAGINKGSLEMVVIQVEQGDCIFIKFPDGQTMLMDAGNMTGMVINGGGNNYDNIQAVLSLYGVNQLDYLFITHSDYDHIKYVEDILKDYEVKCIYLPKCSDKSNGGTWEKAVEAISKETYTAKNGTTQKSEIRFNIGDYEINGNGWRMHCHSYLKADYPVVNSSSASSPTAPDADKAKIVNSLSPICILEYAGRAIVLTGDSNQYNEKYLVDRGVFDQLDADVLKVAHHGSATSNIAEFLQAIKCEYAVISYGKNNPYSHPKSDVLNRLSAVGISDNKLYATASNKDGNVTVTIFGNGAMAIDSSYRNDRDISIPPIAPSNAPVSPFNILIDTFAFERKKLLFAA